MIDVNILRYNMHGDIKWHRKVQEDELAQLQDDKPPAATELVKEDELVQLQDDKPPAATACSYR